ncbi:MAG: NUDIX hydrolase [Chitinophagales bacterium]
MEIWDLYTKKGLKIGQTIERGKVLPSNTYHLVIHFWIKNNAGEFLIQKRSAKVTWQWHLWANTGGSAVSGETSLQALARETKEEIGYEIPLEEVKRIRRFIKNDSLIDVYLLEKNVQLNECEIGEEVDEIRYASQKEIEQLRATGQFWALDDDYFDVIFS